MTLRTKCDPLVSRALTATKLDRVKYAHVLFMKLPETLQLLLALLLVNSRNLKLRLQGRYLSLKIRYLTFKLGRVVKRKRKTFPEYVCHRDLFESVSSNINEAHMSPNY